MGAQPALKVTQVDAFAAARQDVASLPEFLRTEEAQRMSHSDMERELGARGRELVRKLYQAWLDQQAATEPDGPVVDAQGQQRPETRAHERDLETVFGTVRLGRSGYATPGQASLHPLDAQLNLPTERYSLEVRRRVAEEVTKSSFEEVAETLERHTPLCQDRCRLRRGLGQGG